MRTWITQQNFVNQKKELAFLVVGLPILMKMVAKYKKDHRHHDLVKIASKKRAERDASIEEELKNLPVLPKELETLVINSTVTELVQLLNADKVTSEEILNIYHRRAITIGLEYELIAESNYKNALELARKCDEIRKRTPLEDREKLGLLFGVPFSIKDTFYQKGLDATCGLASRCYQPSAEDGWTVKFLKQNGMIPFIRSNLPQLLVLTESPNRIWGRAKNPWNKERTPGGSCGGEGGLVAAKCSPMGFGADGFGSLRIPASYSGLYCFKGTQMRFSQAGQRPLNTYSIARKATIHDNYGPIGRCVNDLALLMRTLVSEDHRKVDPALPYVPWDGKKEALPKKLKIGYCLSDDLFPTSGACKRAVVETIEMLKKQGHICEEIVIPNLRQMILLTLAISNADGKSRGRDEALEGEFPIKELSLSFRITKLPYSFRLLFSNLIDVMGYHRWASVLKNMKELKAYEYFSTVYELFKYKKEFFDFWTAKEFDTMILPGDALPALKHGFGTALALSGCYMYLGNILNLPSGVIPVTKVQPGEDTYDTSGNKEYDYFHVKSGKNMKGSVGLPLSVCVYTLPWEDEKCIGVMRLLESQIQFKELPKL